MGEAAVNMPVVDVSHFWFLIYKNYMVRVAVGLKIEISYKTVGIPIFVFFLIKIVMQG